MTVSALNQVDAQAVADQNEDALAAAYLRVLQAAGRKAAQRFRSMAPLAMTAADAPVSGDPPNWTPPDIDELVDLGLIAEQTARQTASLHVKTLAQVLDAYGRVIRQVTVPVVGRPSFDVTNPLALTLLSDIGGRSGDVAKSIRDDLQKIIGDAYTRGLSVLDAAAIIQEQTDVFAEAQARMLARTDLNGIANGGSVIAAKAVGVTYKTWLTASDDLVRPEHEEANGQTVPVDQPFDVGGESADYPGDPQLSDAEAANCRCYAPWTPLSDATLLAAMRRPFEGDLWRITTAGGRHLAVTGNHPILTRSGWKSAQLLNPGDDLICKKLGDRESSSPNVEGVPSRADEIFAALNLAAPRVERVASERVNFHGDIPDSEVEVAITDDLLPLRGDPALGQEFMQLALALTHREMSLDRDAAPLAGIKKPDAVGGASGTWGAPTVGENVQDSASLNPVLTVEREYAHTSIEVGHDGGDHRGALADHAQALTLPPRATHASLADPLPYDRDADAEMVSDLLVTLAGRVEIDPVVSVEVTPWSGHVYNFQSVGGVYFADGVATANCTVIYADSLDGEESETASAVRPYIMRGPGLPSAATGATIGGFMKPAQITIPLTFSIGTATTTNYIATGGVRESAVEPTPFEAGAWALDPAAGRRWRAVLCVEGTPTEDGRLLETGSISWRELPLSLMAQTETQPGHDGAEVCGRIDRIWREGTRIMGEGVFDSGTFGTEIARLVSDQTLRGLSVDLAVLDFERRPIPGAPEPAEDEMPAEMFVVTEGVIGAATVCSFQAIAEATIEVLTSAAGFKLIRVTSPLATDPVTVVASAAPLYPPADWFENPGLDRPTMLTVTDDGRVFGHVAPWKGCHAGYLGRCVPPPRSRSGYSHFHVGRVKTDGGELVAVGRLTLAAGHADTQGLTLEQARAHYDNTATVAAFVRAGEDEHGIWVAGVLRHDVPPAMVQDLLANPLSGDWRNGEMVAAHAVPLPGFPILQASAIGPDGDEQTALIITSTIGREVAEPDLALRSRVLAARARGIEGLAALAHA